MCSEASKFPGANVPRKRAVVPTVAKTINPFLAVAMDAFIDWKAIAGQTLNTKNLRISEAAIVHVGTENFGCMDVFRHHGVTQTPRHVRILKPTCTKETFANMDVVYRPTPRTLSVDKRKDLAAMLPYLPPDAQAYYASAIDGKNSLFK